MDDPDAVLAAAKAAALEIYEPDEHRLEAKLVAAVEHNLLAAAKRGREPCPCTLREILVGRTGG